MPLLFGPRPPAGGKTDLEPTQELLRGGEVQPRELRQARTPVRFSQELPAQLSSPLLFGAAGVPGLHASPRRLLLAAANRLDFRPGGPAAVHTHPGRPAPSSPRLIIHACTPEILR